MLDIQVVTMVPSFDVSQLPPGVRGGANRLR